MEFKIKLKEYKKQIDKELEIFFDNKIKSIDAEFNKKIVSGLREFVMRGGKRLRPILVVVGYTGFAQENLEIIRASISMELLQGFFLIHDDIMDKDDMRRGGKTFHKIFGEDIGIIGGDLLYGFANEVLADYENKNVRIALKKMNELVEKTCYGQALDLHLNETPFEKVAEEDVLNVYKYKTAFYTIQGPLEIGTLLAGKNLEDFSRFSIPLGWAFQIKDDIIGLFGDIKKTGKPIKSDVEEGKRTLLMLKTYNKADDSEKKFVLLVLGKKISDADFEKLKTLVKKYGLQECQALIKKYVSDAKKEIQKIGFNKEAKSFLLDMCDFIEKRDY